MLLQSGTVVTVLIVFNHSSLLILDCMSSSVASKGETSRLCEDSEAELLTCFPTTVLYWNTMERYFFLKDASRLKFFVLLKCNVKVKG